MTEHPNDALSDIIIYFMQVASKIHLRNKTCFPCLHSLVKTKANVWENSGYGGTDNMFYFFIKLLFSLLTKRKTVYEVCTVNSHNSETGKPHCSHHFHVS